MLPMPRNVRIARWAFNLTLLALLLGLGLMVLAPRLWDVDFRAVVSGSMVPTIPVGAMVVVQPVKPTSIHVGDIITFKSPEDFNLVVTHRVVKITGFGDSRAFRTKGDANLDEDMELVPVTHVLGRVVFHLPLLGYLTQLVRTRQGWLVMVAIPAGVLVLIELINILKVIWTKKDKPTRRTDPVSRTE